MTLPEKLKIGGHWVKVIYPHHFKERYDRCGQYDDTLKEIRISDVDCAGNKAADSAIFVSFIHEVLHAVDIISGHAVFSKNEPAIEGISEGIFQVLVDNKFLDLKKK